MATPPTFVAEYEITWNQSTNRSSASFNTTSGDILVVFAIEESNNSTISISGGSLTWTQRQVVNVGSFTYVSIWTATANTATGISVAFTEDTSTANMWGGNVLHFRDSDGVGASSKTNTSGAPSLGLTTTGDNSAVVVANGDWNAADGTSRTWRTVNSITPSSGNGLEKTYFRDSAAYTVYGAYYSDAGAAGAKTVGLSAPTGQAYSIVAVEVLGVSSGTTSPPPRGLVVSQAVSRASTW